MSSRNTGKLYFLRDRGRRALVGAARKRIEAVKKPSDARSPTSQETVWLARSLYAVGAYLTLHWIAVLSGVLLLAGEAELGSWNRSVAADLLVAALAIAGGIQISRAVEGRDLFSLAAAGGIACLAVTRIESAFRASLARDLAPGERLEICVVAACLLIGIWTVSHSLRMRADR